MGEFIDGGTAEQHVRSRSLRSGSALIERLLVHDDNFAIDARSLPPEADEQVRLRATTIKAGASAPAKPSAVGSDAMLTVRQDAERNHF